jgi:hypothetical protein
VPGALNGANRPRGAGEQFFRALRPGLRREYLPLKLTHYRNTVFVDLNVIAA